MPSLVYSTAETVEQSGWELAAVALGAMSAFCAVAAVLWWLVKPRVEKWARSQIISPLADVHHQTTQNSHKSKDPTLLDRLDDLDSSVGKLRDGMAAHEAWSEVEVRRLWGALSEVRKKS